MMKIHMLRLAVTPIVFCCFSISLSGAVNQPAILLQTEAQKPEGDLSRAAALFSERKYSQALPILERLANADPSDDRAIFGLGVALIYAANSEPDFEKRKQLVIRARQTLIKAKELGVEDYLLNSDLKDLPSDGDDSGSKAVEQFATLWFLHPPEVFDSAPPEGIKLPDGYRHKASTNFEGGTAGIIWKKDGLKIRYEFAYWAGGGDAVKQIKGTEQVWRKKMRSEGLEFEYVLTKDNSLIVSSYRQGVEFADFFVKVGGEQDVEEVLSIIKGLKPRKR
jgi:hypothetical protein